MISQSAGDLGRGCLGCETHTATPKDAEGSLSFGVDVAHEWRIIDLESLFPALSTPGGIQDHRPTKESRDPSFFIIQTPSYSHKRGAFSEVFWFHTLSLESFFLFMIYIHVILTLCALPWVALQCK